MTDEDRRQLMLAASEHDVHAARLGQCVDFIEAHMSAQDAAEAISLLHAAISPAHAVIRAIAAQAPKTEEEPAEEAAPAPKAKGGGRKAKGKAPAEAEPTAEPQPEPTPEPVVDPTPGADPAPEPAADPAPADDRPAPAE